MPGCRPWAESAGSPGVVTDHLAALVLFPTMPPEVIRWDIEISQRAALQPARAAVCDAASQEGVAPMPVLVALGSFVTTLLGGVAALRIGDRRHLVLGLAAG